MFWSRTAYKFLCLAALCFIQTRQHEVIEDITEDEHESPSATADNSNVIEDLINNSQYLSSTIPMRVYECLNLHHSLLRCVKLYMLEKLKESRSIPHNGNLTRDFMDQFFGAEEHMGSLVAEQYNKLNEKQLNQLLALHLQKFFKNRNIKLHFLDGLLVKVIPSKDNKLKLALKKGEKKQRLNESVGRSQKKDDDLDENVSLDGDTFDSAGADVVDLSGDTKDKVVRKKRKNKKDSLSYKSTILQVAVPVMVMPAILMGSILPFLLPVLKMGTIMAMMLNNSAFLAALLYAARTHANANDEQHISYGPPYGFHR